MSALRRPCGLGEGSGAGETLAQTEHRKSTVCLVLHWGVLVEGYSQASSELYCVACSTEFTARSLQLVS